MTKRKKCPLEKAGISPSDAAYNDATKNKIKDICLKCELERCVFDTNRKARKYKGESNG